MGYLKITDCSPVFVVGIGRSGTTLLQLLLNSHPNIAIYGEIHYFYQISRLKSVIPSLGTPRDIDEFHSMVRNTPAFEHLPNAETIYQAAITRLKSDSYPTYESFYRNILEEFARLEGKSRFGEKTPSNVRYLDRVLHIFPNAKIIHIVRDPRDVVASLGRANWASNEIIENSLKWKYYVGCGNRFS